MSSSDFEVEWQGGEHPATPPRSPRHPRQRRWIGWWVLLGCVLVTALAVPLLITRSHTKHRAAPTTVVSEHSTSATAAALLRSCSTLVGTAYSTWEGVLSGTGCTMDGRSVARFALTDCTSGSRLWSIQANGTGYWAATGLLFHKFGPDPAHDAAYLVAYRACFRTDSSQHVRLGSTALIETPDGDAQVTLALNGPAGVGTKARPVVLTVRVTCVFGTTTVNAGLVGTDVVDALGTPLSPTQTTLPPKDLAAGGTDQGTLTFDTGRPTIFSWVGEFDDPLAYWS